MWDRLENLVHILADFRLFSSLMSESGENGQFECFRWCRWYSPKLASKLHWSAVTGQQVLAGTFLLWEGDSSCQQRVLMETVELAMRWVAAIFNTVRECMPEVKSEPSWLYFLGPGCTVALLFYPARSFSVPTQESQQLTAVADSSDRAGVRSAGFSSFITRTGKRSQTAFLSWWRNNLLKIDGKRHKKGSEIKLVVCLFLCLFQLRWDLGWSLLDWALKGIQSSTPGIQALRRFVRSCLADVLD